MHLGGAAVLLATISLVLADIQYTLPVAGGQYPISQKLTVTWADAGAVPAISDLTFASLTLFSGSNAAPFPMFTFPATTLAALTTSTLIGDVGGSTPNAYFLGLRTFTAANVFYTYYSNRFTLTGMTGTFQPAIQTALAGVTGTAGPPTLIEGAAPAAGGDFGVPYNLQTGLTKFAPMQPLPPTSITAQNTSPQWPTSSVVIAKTFLPIPSVQTTITQAGTFKFQSHPNTAAAQSQPTGDMQKFLNRWKD